MHIMLGEVGNISSETRNASQELPVDCRGPDLHASSGGGRGVQSIHIIKKTLSRKIRFRNRSV